MTSCHRSAAADQAFMLDGIIGSSPDADRITDLFTEAKLEVLHYDDADALVEQFGGELVARMTVLLICQTARGLSHDSAVAWLRSACAARYTFNRADRRIVKKLYDDKMAADKQLLDDFPF